MNRTRVIPTLLLNESGLVKTRQFRKAEYIGDPINAVKILNEKEVDELLILDIEASIKGYSPRFETIKKIASEAFMPVAYGGGVKTIEEIDLLFRIGVEKVVLGGAIYPTYDLVRDASRAFGSQSIAVSVDVRPRAFRRGYQVYSLSGTLQHEIHLYELLCGVQKAGAGEVILNAIHRDGMQCGFDIDLIRSCADRVQVPLVALGGARNSEDLAEAINAGASAVAAGSMFVYHGRHRAVLISYLKKSELDAVNETYNRRVIAS